MSSNIGNWLPQEDAVLREFWPLHHVPVSSIAKKLPGRSLSACVARAGRIGCPVRPNPTDHAAAPRAPRGPSLKARPPMASGEGLSLIMMPSELAALGIPDTVGETLNAD